MGYKTAISDFWNFENFGKLEIFFYIYFYFCKNPPKFPNFQKENDART